MEAHDVDRAPSAADDADSGADAVAITRAMELLSTHEERPSLLLSLPTEIICRIMHQLASGGDFAPAAIAASTCLTLRDAAAWWWHETALGMLGDDTCWDGPNATFQVVSGASTLSHAKWQPAPHLHLPFHSFAHSSVLWQGKLYLFGGRHNDVYRTGLHSLSLPPLAPEWKEIPTRGTPPEPRRAHTACVHKGLLYILGGGQANATIGHGDMHVIDLSLRCWTQLPSPPDWQAFGHTCVVASLSTSTLRIPPFKSRLGKQHRPLAHAPQRRPSSESNSACLIVFGGAWQSSASGFIHATNRVLRYDISNELWEEVHPRGRPPEDRYRHTSCIVGQSMAVWGGYVLHAHVMQPRQHQVNPGDKFACMNADDLFLLDLNSYKWSSPVVHGTPPSPRGGHSMVLVHNKLVIYGGGDLTYTYGMEQWHERDVGTVHWLDTTTWTYGAPSIPDEEVPEEGSILGGLMLIFCNSADENSLSSGHIRTIPLILERLPIHFEEHVETYCNSSNVWHGPHRNLRQGLENSFVGCSKRASVAT